MFKQPDKSILEVLIEPKEKLVNRDRLLIILVVISVVSFSMMVYFWRQAGNVDDKPSSITLQEDVKKLVEQLGEVIVLPEDEEPTIATVTDPELLRGQPFFENAKIGYKVLIYSKAKKAILYDPESRKIVDIAPINLE